MKPLHRTKSSNINLECTKVRNTVDCHLLKNAAILCKLLKQDQDPRMIHWRLAFDRTKIFLGFRTDEQVEHYTLYGIKASVCWGPVSQMG